MFSQSRLAVQRMSRPLIQSRGSRTGRGEATRGASSVPWRGASYSGRGRGTPHTSGNGRDGNTTGRDGATRGESSVPWRGASYSGRGRGGPPNSGPRRPPSVTHDFASLHRQCAAAWYKVHKPGCECAKIEQARSALSSAASGSSTTNRNALVLDGLVVIPDTRARSTSHIFLCLDTGAETFQREALEVEKKLMAEMFPENAAPDFKASCAACLLEDVPNGFVCISSSSRQTVDLARDFSRNEAKRKREEGNLHADHAHFVCSLSKHTLYELYHDDREREKDPCWSIDLPGGKRHLGETSWQCAVRETEEEISLQVDQTWQVEDDPRRGKHASERMNVYYFLTPPSELLVKSLETSFGKLMDSDLGKNGRVDPLPDGK